MYEIHLEIDQDTPEGKILDQIMRTEHVSPGEAVRAVLRERAGKSPAEAMFGAFSSAEDAELIDEVMILAYERRKADMPRDFGL